MNTENYGVATFKSTHHAIQAEGVLKENDIFFKTIPTPREITFSCGLALLFALDDVERVIELVENDELNVDAIYNYIKSKEGNKAEKII
jgi:hypothetical protein